MWLCVWVWLCVSVCMRRLPTTHIHKFSFFQRMDGNVDALVLVVLMLVLVMLLCGWVRTTRVCISSASPPSRLTTKHQFAFTQWFISCVEWIFKIVIFYVDFICSREMGESSGDRDNQMESIALKHRGMASSIPYKWMTLNVKLF